MAARLSFVVPERDDTVADSADINAVFALLESIAIDAWIDEWETTPTGTRIHFSFFPQR